MILTFNNEKLIRLERELGRGVLLGISLLSALYVVTFAIGIFRPDDNKTSIPVGTCVVRLIEGGVVLGFSVLFISWLKKGLFRGRDVIVSMIGTILLSFLLICVFGTRVGVPIDRSYSTSSTLVCSPDWLPKFEVVIARGRRYPLSYDVPVVGFSGFLRELMLTIVIRYPGIIMWIATSCLLRLRTRMRQVETSQTDPLSPINPIS